jgi:hypothetical protein
VNHTSLTDTDVDEVCVSYLNGTQEWRNQKGVLHRTDGPALIHSDGGQEWYHHGDLHRTDGPALIHSDGGQAWYHHGDLHRTDGPALIRSDGTQAWYHHGQLHRTDGPAVIHSDGGQRWYVSHKNITREVRTWMSNRGVSWPWDLATQLEFVLTWL